jgi:hypothetical protein
MKVESTACFLLFFGLLSTDVFVHTLLLTFFQGCLKFSYVLQALQLKVTFDENTIDHFINKHDI